MPFARTNPMLASFMLKQKHGVKQPLDFFVMVKCSKCIFDGSKTFNRNGSRRAKDFVRNNFRLWFPCSAWEPAQGRSASRTAERFR